MLDERYTETLRVHKYGYYFVKHFSHIYNIYIYVCVYVCVSFCGLQSKRIKRKKKNPNPIL